MAHLGDLISTYMLTCRQEAQIITAKSQMRPRIAPNFVQDGIQEPPGHAPNLENPPKTLYCRPFLNFTHFGKDRSKNQKIIQDNSQNDVKIAILVATSAILGRNLLPSDPKKLIKFLVLGSFGEVLAPKSPTRHARPLPRAPETPSKP